MAGTLYLVATPIGNLGDLSPRAVETLRTADFIAAEDTRVSVKLLNHFGIKKSLVSYHEHNHVTAGQAILSRLLAGESCALVTDAGTPAISDPGEDLVRLCGQQDITVQAIPGCCAAVNALAVSGLPTGRFTFEGFLTVNKKSRRERLEQLRTEERTMIFHEAPHKLRTTLADMLEVLGDRPVALCRELTYQRNVKLGRPCAIPSDRDAGIVQTVTAAVNAENPLEGERLLLDLEFRRLDGMIGLHNFDDHALFGYAMKLQLLERQRTFRYEAGKRAFDELMAGIRQQVSSL